MYYIGFIDDISSINWTAKLLPIIVSYLIDKLMVMAKCHYFKRMVNTTSHRTSLCFFWVNMVKKIYSVDFGFDDIGSPDLFGDFWGQKLILFGDFWGQKSPKRISLWSQKLTFLEDFWLFLFFHVFNCYTQSLYL